MIHTHYIFIHSLINHSHTQKSILSSLIFFYYILNLLSFIIKSSSNQLIIIHFYVLFFFMIITKKPFTHYFLNLFVVANNQISLPFCLQYIVIVIVVTIILSCLLDMYFPFDYLQKITTKALKIKGLGCYWPLI